MIRLKQKKAEPKPEEVASGTNLAEEKKDVSNEASSSSISEVNGESSANSGLKLFGVGGKQSTSTEVKKPGKKRTPGELRIQKDITDLDGGTVAKITFPNANDLTNFHVTMSPDSGFWSGAKYDFTFEIPADYPHRPPKVLCNTKIYHPNINLQGNVCLNILREDWKPVLDINAVIYGLIYLFYEPNPDDPLNREAAELYRNDRAQFQQVVRRTLQGYSHAGETFERLIK